MSEPIDIKKTVSNILIERGVPDFVLRDYPQFVAFLRAYYEFLEIQKNPTDVINHLVEYTDIDRTLNEFVDHFRETYLINIPEHILADKRLLAKNIKDFYLAKGNEESYRFLFRILYNEDIEFYYPKTDILKASDGKWSQQISIKIIKGINTDLTRIVNKRITGLTSGASALVETILSYNERGTDILELTLSDIRGLFLIQENIAYMYLDGAGVQHTGTETICALYTGVVVDDGGSGYSINDKIPIRNAANVQIGLANIKQTTRGKVEAISIANGGSGYQGLHQTLTHFAALPMNFTFEGVYLHDAPLKAITSNDIDFASYQINQTIPTTTIDFDTGDLIQIGDSSEPPGSGAYGVVTLVNDTGVIQTIELLAQGDLYELPTATVVSVHGTGAAINVTGGGGAVKLVTMETFPIELEADEDSNGFTAYPDFSGKGLGNATGHLTTSFMAQYPGRFLNEDGQLSSNKRLQDNYFYQDYSYVIKVGISVDKWKDIVKKIIHPAGLAVFGEVSILTTGDLPMVAKDAFVTIS